MTNPTTEPQEEAWPPRVWLSPNQALNAWNREKPSFGDYLEYISLAESQAREKAAADRAEAKTLLRIARHARIYWGDAVADQITRWYEDAQQSATDDQRYSCYRCGALRTKEEGGTVFSVCDACWDKAHPTATEAKGK